MSGMSDVRLALHGQELEAGRGPALSVNASSRWALFWRRSHTRKALLDMTIEQLRDIGLTAEQARREGVKPFWRS